MFVVTKGKLLYSRERIGFKLICTVDKELFDYYSSLTPSCLTTKKPDFDPHITVYRSNLEKIKDMRNWGKHQGELVSFGYIPQIFYNDDRYHLAAYSIRLEEIRKELGLPNENLRQFRHFNKKFHITLGSFSHRI